MARAISRFATLEQAISSTSADDRHQREQRIRELLAQAGAALGAGQHVHPHLQELLLAWARWRCANGCLLHLHLQNLVKQRLQSRLRLLQRHARLQPPEDLHEAAAPVVQRVEPSGAAASFIIIGTRICGA